MSLEDLLILGLIGGAVILYALYNLPNGPGLLAPLAAFAPKKAAQGYHNNVWYDDLAAKPIEHTIFGPFQNEYEDPLAGVTPAGLTPPPVDVRLTIA